MEGILMNKNMVRILSLVVALSMMLTTAAFAAPQKDRFKHFDKKYELKLDDYENALKALVDKEIVKGYGNGDYGLSGNVKRGDIIVMIIRMFEKYEKIDIDLDEIKDAFEDVYKNDYFFESIAKAKKLGIAKGDGKHFNPNKPVTVQEAIWLIERAGEKLGLDVSEGIIEDLEDIYENELDKFAKRRDIFWMLYYVLDMVEYEEPEDDEDTELEDIVLNMNDTNELKFMDKWFEEVYDDLLDEDSDVEELDYIKFDLPIKNGKLYYNYNPEDDKNEAVEEDIRYYLGSTSKAKIDKITLVSNDNFSGTITVKYFAIDNEGETYTGYMKITVDNDMLLDDISYNTDENKPVTFDKEDFKKFIDKIKFELPNDKIGRLYLDDDKDSKAENDELLSRNEEVKYDDLDNIIFVPYKDYDGKAVIKYTAIKYVEDEDNVTYDGKVIINVKEVQEIPNLSFTPDFDDGSYKIDIAEELEDLVDEDLLDDFEYIKFTLPEEGTLRIKLEDSKRTVIVSADKNYNLDDVEYILYEFEDEGKVQINYTVYDDEGKEYDGKIVLDIK